MRVGITGGSGFIAQHVIEKLHGQGHETVTFDLKHGDITGSVCDLDHVTAFVNQVDSVIHLAGVLGSQETIQDPYPAIYTNTVGSVNVFTALQGKPCVMLVCGNWFADNSYAISKTAAEGFVRMFNLYRGGQINVVRAVNAYGPGQSVAYPYGPSSVRKIMPSFVCRALSGHPIEVYGDGTQISAMVYVTDVADQIVWALTQACLGTVFGRAVGAGPVEATTVLQTAELVSEIAGPVPITFLPMRPGEDPTRPVTAPTDLGLNPRGFVSLRDGIERTVAWYRESEGVTWGFAVEAAA